MKRMNGETDDEYKENDDEYREYNDEYRENDDIKKRSPNYKRSRDINPRIFGEDCEDLDQEINSGQYIDNKVLHIKRDINALNSHL